MLSVFRHHAVRIPLTRLSSTVTAAPTLYLVTAPDCSDSGALSRRLSVRPTHFERANPLHERGVIQYAGATLDDEGKMNGSILVLRAHTLDDTRRCIEEDIYWEENIWDREKLTIVPFRQALPNTPVVKS
ncbi:hypothetical protein BKA62DRAFT_644531 [Auriculariales sp. MPI-PUGE-AT-0066]|nr:hypothetical protein BKA62DRAFT_644531 [Auriculariales sp. MPI-PUGE-AT-0066]